MTDGVSPAGSAEAEPTGDGQQGYGSELRSVPTPNTTPASGKWTFLTNHAHVLVVIARDRGVRLRDIAARVGITERAAQAIVKDLVDAGYVVRMKVGRRNTYAIRSDLPFRHPIEQDHMVGELVGRLAEPIRLTGT